MLPPRYADQTSTWKWTSPLQCVCQQLDISFLYYTIIPYESPLNLSRTALPRATVRRPLSLLPSPYITPLLHIASLSSAPHSYAVCRPLPAPVQPAQSDGPHTVSSPNASCPARPKQLSSRRLLSQCTPLLPPPPPLMIVPLTRHVCRTSPSSGTIRRHATPATPPHGSRPPTSPPPTTASSPTAASSASSALLAPAR
jgi:hypothetical protein